MAKASTSVSTPEFHGNPAISAAEAVLALINSQPRTPTKDELAAIIAPHMIAASPKGGVPKLRAEWDALSAEIRVADAKCHALAEASGGILTKEVEAAEEEEGPINDRLSDCAERILAEPVHGSADLMLLAEACYWIMWTEPYGLTAPNADECLADGPPHIIDESGICIDVLAALFRGIRDATRGASSSQPIVPALAMPAPDVAQKEREQQAPATVPVEAPPSAGAAPSAPPSPQDGLNT